MKNQSNGLVYLLVMAALISLIYAKDMNQMRIMIHLLMIFLVIILMIQFMLLPFFKMKQSKKEWNQLHGKDTSPSFVSKIKCLMKRWEMTTNHLC